MSLQSTLHEWYVAADERAPCTDNLKVNGGLTLTCKECESVRGTSTGCVRFGNRCERFSNNSTVISSVSKRRKSRVSFDGGGIVRARIDRIDRSSSRRGVRACRRLPHVLQLVTASIWLLRCGDLLQNVADARSSRGGSVKS